MKGPHHTYTLAEELGVNLIYAGHYATETFGVKALAEHLADEFEVEHDFIDHPTGALIGGRGSNVTPLFADGVSKHLFRSDPVTAARGLIGARLVCGGCSGIVVETEAYAATGDEAAHTFFKPSARAFVARHAAGSAYVYLNYGMYWLANVLTRGDAGEEGFVLLRALEPERGLATMRRRRGKERPRDLCSGPGKLTIALGINGADHGGSFVGDAARFWFEPGDADHDVVDDTRIGISRATGLRWRFLAAGSEFVSKPPGKGA